jgi:hypothetical protein
MVIMRRFIALACTLLLVSYTHAQVVFVIDTFDNTNGSAADGALNANGVWNGFGPGISGVLGGNRVLGNYLTEITVGDPGPFTNSTNISSGVFNIDNPFNTRSAGQVIWQGTTTTPGVNSIISDPASFGLGSINFNTVLSSSEFYFQWSVINADNRDWTYTFRAYTNNASNYFVGTATSNLSGVTLNIPKGSFTAVGSPTWADIDAVSFSASYTGGLLGGDLAVDFFQLAVPEMSTYLMLSLTLLLLGVYRVYFSKPAKTEAKADDNEEKDALPFPPVSA